jgi:hypothetical protein
MKQKSALMMIATFLAVLTFVFIGCGDKKAEEGDKKDEGAGSEAKVEKPDLAQAEPVWALFVAVQNDKIEDFKALFSKEAAADLAKAGWDGMYKDFGGDIKGLLGKDFKLADFEWKYDGDDKKGKVIVTFKGKKVPKMKVCFEGGKWMINEK